MWRRSRVWWLARSAQSSAHGSATASAQIVRAPALLHRFGYSTSPLEALYTLWLAPGRSCALCRAARRLAVRGRGPQAVLRRRLSGSVGLQKLWRACTAGQRPRPLGPSPASAACRWSADGFWRAALFGAHIRLGDFKRVMKACAEIWASFAIAPTCRRFGVPAERSRLFRAARVSAHIWDAGRQ